MIRNYHEEFVKNPPQFRCTEAFIEEREIKALGGLWNDSFVDGKNGADGWLQPLTIKNSDQMIYESPIEIKCQIYQTNSNSKNGPQKLLGRGKFGAGSKAIAEKKSSTGEIVYVVGADTEGVIYYKYSYLFCDIVDRYLETVEKYKDKPHSNIDPSLLPWEIHKKDSFQMHFIHPDIEKLMFNGPHKRFTNNLHKFLCEFDRKKLINPLEQWEKFLRHECFRPFYLNRLNGGHTRLTNP